MHDDQCILRQELAEVTVNWLIILTCAILLGWFASLLLNRFLKASLSIPVALAGAILGGILAQVTQAGHGEMWAFYGMSFFCTFLAFVGAIWTSVLVRSEKRV